jgi:competence protein ComEA
MSDQQLPSRPPDRSVVGRLNAWVAWVGVPKILVTSVAVIAVGVGSWWLIRSEPPVEAGLPVVSVPVVPVSVASAPSDTDSTAPAELLVHVAGAVVRPGLYELPPRARVDDAIRSAGGPVDDADLNGVNLAAPVADGQRIYVPVAGEVDPASVGSGESVATGPVDLNAASAEELTTLPGIGPSTAAAIVEDRSRNGPFTSVDDLDRVPGIGPGRLSALAGLVRV